MHSSIAVRRPITSPCLLCTLRAAALDQPNSRTTVTRRRLTRRVHTSANRRRAAQGLAERPEPEDVPQYNHAPVATPTPQFQGFFGTGQASAGPSKWAVQKPAPAVPPPPPPPPPPAAETVSSAPSISRVASQSKGLKFDDHVDTNQATNTPSQPPIPSSRYRAEGTVAESAPRRSFASSSEPIWGSPAPPAPGTSTNPRTTFSFNNNKRSNDIDSHLKSIFGETKKSSAAFDSQRGSVSWGTQRTQPASANQRTGSVAPSIGAAAKWGTHAATKSVFSDPNATLDQFSAPRTSNQNSKKSGSSAFSSPRKNSRYESSMLGASEGTHKGARYSRDAGLDLNADNFAGDGDAQLARKKWSQQLETGARGSFHDEFQYPTNYGAVTKNKNDKEVDLEEILEEYGGKRKKKQRGAPLAEEQQQWDRKQSARSKDKSKHGREWVVEAEDDVEVESKAARKEKKRLEREAKAKEREEMQQQFPPILIPEFVSITALARLCKVKIEPFTDKLQDLGFTELNPDHLMNAETAGLIAMEFGFEPIVDKSHERDLFALKAPADKSVLPSRPPVVTIMGHVDHGKTTILDWLRKSSIVDQEHGGITQHIGAFSVTMPSGRNITFLDTPGHEAFLNMRERGANMTDIVILVVAADDSIMPQTIEAIKHAKAAKVPIIVAINKCDKPDADPEKVKSDLAQYEVEIEEVGGATQVVCISGKTGLGMEDLEESILLESDQLDVRAEKVGRVEGWIVETTTKTRGRVATVLVRRGILRRGDVIVAGKTWAKVRNLVDENGVELDEVLPGMPVEIDGWKDQPAAGDEVLQAETEDKAKSVVEYRLFKEERKQLAIDIEAINEQRRLVQEKKDREARLKELEKEGVENPEAELPTKEDKFQILEVPFIVKADVAGSVEAVAAQVLSVANGEVRTKIIRSGVGPLLESDVAMAEGTGAYCLTFNVDDDPDILAMARQANVKILEHNVIYAILDDVKRIMSEKLKPIILKNIVGEAEIIEIFNYKVKNKETRPFAGCRVTKGVVNRGSKVKIMRKGEVVYDGELETLKNVKKVVDEMKKDSECGMGFLKFKDFQKGDIVQCYTETTKRRTFD